VPVIGGREKIVGEGLAEAVIEGSLVPEERQEEKGEQEERDPLHGRQDERLKFYVRRLSAADTLDAEEEDTETVGE